MNPETLRQAVAHIGLPAAGISFLAGLVFSFNPVAFAAIPVALAYVTRTRARRLALLFGAMFILGMVLMHAVLGFIAGLGGHWAQSLVGREWGLVLGPLLVFLGLLWPGWVRLPLPALALRAKRPTGAIGAFLLGIAFSVAVCPVCTPALVVLIGVAAGLASPLFGLVLLLAFALGRAVPIIVGAVAIGSLENWRGFARHRKAFEVIGGVTLILSGLYMLNAYYFWIPALAG